MKISVRVKPNSKKTGVEEAGPNRFLVRVKAPPKEGKANEEVIASLARHFGLPKSRVTIVAGSKSSSKIVNLEGGD